MKDYFIYLLLFTCTLVGCLDSPDMSFNEPASQNLASLDDEQLIQLALEYIGANHKEFQVSRPSESLMLQQIERDSLGAQHLKFSQHVRQVPIWGSEIAVHVKEGSVYFANGQTYPDDMVVSIVPGITAQAAEQIAVKAVASAGSNPRSKSQLVILPQSLQAGLLSYLVEISAGLKRYLMFVDASTGAIVKQIDGMPSQSGKADKENGLRELA